MNKTVMLLITSIVFSTLILSLIAFPFPASAQKGLDLIPGKGEVIGVFGEIPGQDLIVHVLVLVPHGADKNEVVSEALRQQGARPWAHDEFSTTGLVWDQFFDSNPDNNRVTQNYNPQNDPDGSFTALTNTYNSWNGVTTSIFVFDFGGTTDRCPSLVRECQGPQYFDDKNDVAWLELRGGNTLGVTWFSTSRDEADMALNLDFDWATVEEEGFDIETVFLHENGHVVGLGHSEILQAVMYPSYQGVRQDLHPDDEAGISSLYPVVNGNVPPVAVDDAYFTDEDIILNIPAPGVLANDTDTENDPLNAVLESTTSNGALTLNADGSFSYTPNADFNGVDPFTYRANDGTSNSNNIATVSITINPVNDPPVAVDDADTVLKGGMVTTNVLANDSDVDGTLDPLTVTVVGTPVNGIAIANADGTITYTHDGSETTSGSYTYTVDDDDGATSNIATVTIAVNTPSAGVSVVSISPNPIDRCKCTIPMTITGSGFSPNVAITITGGDGPTPKVSNITVSDLQVTFDATLKTGGPSGSSTWTVTVTNTVDGTSDSTSLEIIKQ